ncbi:hypothetical protein AF333_22845 [Aneurinibacillus migulanus]|jgi:hypothetical protein|uniref:Uncharacterized protein n=1 Tax=Aneurinibacillus migulanus TaxID=47500 RepID=A0A0M0H7Y4_ANEMI|nr:hypothetical protein TS64_16245 [Aneurinibacillus migulanus]KON97847.1 hypothetical protein AF333_22845 [Aneurinibacillus migulanus]
MVLKNHISSVIDWIFLIFLLCTLLIQISFKMMLGADIPIVISKEEFDDFLYFSVWIFILSAAYIILKFKTNNGHKMAITTSALAFYLFIWILILKNTISNPHPQLLLYSAYIGIATNVLLMLTLLATFFYKRNWIHA